MTTTTPARNDAEKIPEVTVTWDGFTFTVPAEIDDWNADTMKAFEDGKAINAVQRLLGPRQSNSLADHIRTSTGRAPRVREYGAVMEAIAKALGFASAGE